MAKLFLICSRSGLGKKITMNIFFCPLCSLFVVVGAEETILTVGLIV